MLYRRGLINSLFAAACLHRAGISRRHSKLPLSACDMIARLSCARLQATRQVRRKVRVSRADASPMESPRLRMARVGLLLWTSNRPWGKLSETRPSSTTCVVGRELVRLVPPEILAFKSQRFQKLSRTKILYALGNNIDQHMHARTHHEAVGWVPMGCHHRVAGIAHEPYAL